MSFLVVRVGKVYDIDTKRYITQDPILEIDKVLNNFETCFFAKFGKKLNLKKIRDLSKDTDLHLVIVNKDGDYYKSKTYKLISANDEIKVESRNYPSYYIGKEHFVGTWFEVRHSLYEALLADLYVASSYSKLTTSMSLSMSSFFFCRLDLAKS